MPTSFDVLLKNWLTKISNSIKGISVSGDTLTVTKTDNSTEDLTLGLQALERKIFAQSTWYKRPELPTPDKTTITIPAGTQVAINGTLYISTTPQELRLNTVINAETRKGKDMYIYACVPNSGTEPVFAVSLYSTVPTGYTADTSRKIGGFHCLCADVGTIAGHTLSGYSAGDILPASVWDLLFRSESENEGMVYVNGEWIDIYYTALNAGRYVSVSGLNPLGWNVSGEQGLEGAALVKKRYITRDAFVMAAQGSNEMTSIDLTMPTQNGGHIDTNGRRMISNYGLEDCCGFHWQRTADIFGAYNGVSNSNFAQQGGIGPNAQTADPASLGSVGLNSYILQSDGRGTTNINTDGALNVKGLALGALARIVVGGERNHGVECGSRAVALQFLSSAGGSGIGFAMRLVASPRVVNL